MTAVFTAEQQEERLYSRSVVTENKKGKGRDEGREKPLTPPTISSPLLTLSVVSITPPLGKRQHGKTERDEGTTELSSDS